MTREFYYPSCGVGNIRAKCWEPERVPSAIVQIVHGIAEHIDRYDAFASALNADDVLVVAQDHMGHGKSCQTGSAKGYFHGGWFAAVADTVQLMEHTMRLYPNTPYFLFGHSMGSFMVRTILAKYPDCEIAGCVVCGTGWMPDSVISAGKQVSNMICRFCGEQNPSKFLQRMMFGSYNKRVEHPRTAYDWLTRSSAVVDAYIADPDCGFTVSAGLVRDMLSGIQYIQKSKTLKQMNPKIPVLFIAGGDDPVGNYAEGVKRAVMEFQKAGMKKVSCHIYPLCRHEILSEINRQDIFNDVVCWIKET